MQFGDEIQMLRDYDDGRYAAGETYTVAVPGEPEDGKVMPGVARSLCREAADGQGAYATKVSDDSDDDSDLSDKE